MEAKRHWQKEPEEIFRQGPVVPVVVIHKVEHAVSLAKALMAGGIRVIEITLRTPVAAEAIRAISQDVPGAIVGAGTVTSAEELTAVAEAGAVFAISPGLTVELLQAANQGSIPLIPGISTVSELMTGMALGYTHFKFFPAEAAGGIKMLKAISGPFPQPYLRPASARSPRGAPAFPPGHPAGKDTVRSRVNTSASSPLSR